MYSETDRKEDQDSRQDYGENGGVCTVKKEYTCIVCPNGCQITAERSSEQEEYRITGYRCGRGVSYVRQELTDPRRTFATSVGVRGGSLPLVSVRTSSPVPLSRIPEAVNEIHAQILTAPVQTGDVVVHGLLGLDCDVIATRTVEACQRGGNGL